MRRPHDVVQRRHGDDGREEPGRPRTKEERSHNKGERPHGARVVRALVTHLTYIRRHLRKLM